MRARHTSTQSDLQCPRRAGRALGGLHCKRSPSFASPGAPQCLLVAAAFDFARPKEQCWSSVKRERPCAASTWRPHLANEKLVWRNVGLGETSNVAADTPRSFSRSSEDACDCLLERGITVTAWRVHRGSHLTLSILVLVEVVGEMLVSADPIDRFSVNPDTLPGHCLHG